MLRPQRHFHNAALVFIAFLACSIPVSSAEPSRTQLRGFMIGTVAGETNLKDQVQLLASWNVNVIRWQLAPPPWDPTGEKLGFDVWVSQALSRLDAVLPTALASGVKIVLDLHTPPPGLFQSPDSQAQFLKFWRGISAKYKNTTAIYGYDLLNEPDDSSVSPGLRNWRELAEDTAKEIRKIDSIHVIIIEPKQGHPPNISDFQPIGLGNIVYSVHMYIPHAFTHQGVSPQWPLGPVYPGVVDGERVNKSRLRSYLQPVVDWQAKHNAKIYIGEFSAIRWAPSNSAFNYLSDAIEIFEANGWDWTYHAFREWDGWSVEHDTNLDSKRPVYAPTDRLLLLRSWFSKNSRG